MRFIRPSKNKNSGLDSTFRDGLKDMRATPDPELWDKISDNIDADIKRKKYNHWYLAALLLLLPVTLTNVFVNYDIEEYYTEFANENGFGTDEELNKKVQNAQFLNLPNSNNWSVASNRYKLPVLIAESSSGKSNSNNASFSEVENLSDNTIDKLNSSFGSKNISSNNKSFSTPSSLEQKTEAPAIYLASISPDLFSGMNMDVKEAQSIPVLDNVMTDKESFKKHSKTSRKQELNAFQSGIYAGTSVGVQQNKLFRREGQFAPILGDNVKLENSPSFTYGARIGWNFNRFLAIETGIYKSEMNVNFLDNRYNKIFTEGNISARYFEVPVNLKFRYSAFNGINSLPHAFALTTGITYAQLHSSELVFGDVTFENTDDYFDPMQLALNLGLEYEWFVHRNISLSLGGQASMFSSKQDFPQFSVKNAKSDLRLNYQFQFGLNFLLPTSK